ncbi:MAG: hypothetical protein WCP39_03400 [Chlamydiota bacterium]
MEIDGLSIINPVHIIPLKARAWLDLSAQAKAGKYIDEKDIRKHRNDIIKLHQLLSPDIRIQLPQPIRQDLLTFLDQIKDCSTVDLKALGLRNIIWNEVLDTIYHTYYLKNF